MKKLFVTAFVFGIALGIGLCFLIPDFGNTYANKMQAPLFTGFITLGSLLLALKSFVIIQLKKEIYDRESYQKLYAEMKTLNSKLELYAPLSRLSFFLVYAVIFALGTSLTQITLGFLGQNWSSAICVGLAGVTLVLIIGAWWNIKNNVKRMFAIWEEEAKNSKA